MPPIDWTQPVTHVYGHGIPLWLCVMVITVAAGLYVLKQFLRGMAFVARKIKQFYTWRVGRAASATRKQLDNFVRDYPRTSGMSELREQLGRAERALGMGQSWQAAGEFADVQATLRRMQPLGLRTRN